MLGRFLQNDTTPENILKFILNSIINQTIKCKNLDFGDVRWRRNFYILHFEFYILTYFFTFQAATRVPHLPPETATES
jgi:hypothetical protein